MTSSSGIALSSFDDLRDRASTGRIPVDGFAVEQIDPSRHFIYLACSDVGDLALVVTTQASQHPPPPLRLAALSADFGTKCELNDGSESRALRVSVLRCTSGEQSTRELFATVCGAISESLTTQPSEREFADLISNWSSLFWRIGQRVDTDVVGLAGELLVLRRAPSIRHWLEAWHAQPTDTLDFEFLESQFAVEVKCTRASRRRHAISLDQVTGSRLDNLFFASVLVDLNDSGESLGDIVRELTDRLSDDSSRLLLWAILTKSCGSGLEDFLSRRIDRQKAASSLAFFRARDIPIPHVSLPLPAGVSALKFTSDFSDVSEVSADEVDAAVQSRRSFG